MTNLQTEIPRNARGHFIKKAIPAAVRRELAARHGCKPGSTVQAQCHYCDHTGQISWVVQPTDRGPGWVAFSGLEMDHMTAEIAGGTNSADNIVLACTPCNRSKSIMALATWRAAHA